jgi:NDP-sugar pyrophosphorylase family protein
MKKNTTDIAIVYMVAGLSSRFGGKIKQFARVGPNNETLVEYSLNQALPAGFSKIVFIVGEKTEMPFREMFGEEYRGIPVSYVLQKYDSSLRERPWGTTDALCSAKELLDCPFVVCNGDDLYGENSFRILVNNIKENKGSENATLGYRLKNVLPKNGKVNRGIFEIDKDNNVRFLKEVFEIEKTNLNEKGLSEDDLCSMNCFSFSPKVLDYLYEILKEFREKNKGDRRIECLLPADIGRLIQQGKLKLKIYPTEDIWLGVTNPEDEILVKEKLKIN